MYEVWMIRRRNNNDSYSYYAYMSGLSPEFVANIECAKHFKTEDKVQKAFKEVSLCTVGAEIFKAKVRTL